MSRSSLRALVLSLALGALLSGPAAGKVYITEPLLVSQPAYAGMQFYVYRPYNMPKGWYVTFDGYAVHKNGDGIWVYGTSNGPVLTPTNYVVGSVIPSMAAITPWVHPAQISELRKLPTAETGVIRQSAPLPATNGPAYSTWIPDWTYNGRFMAIGNWKPSVDRMGILHNPAVPVAWKGEYPKVIYVWTGRNWHQVMARERETPMGALRRELYNLVRIVRNNDFTWYEGDVPILAQQCAAWGYYWIGEVLLSR